MAIKTWDYLSKLDILPVQRENTRLKKRIKLKPVKVRQ